MAAAALVVECCAGNLRVRSTQDMCSGYATAGCQASKGQSVKEGTACRNKLGRQGMAPAAGNRVESCRCCAKEHLHSCQLHTFLFSCPCCMSASASSADATLPSVSPFTTSTEPLPAPLWHSCRASHTCQHACRTCQGVKLSTAWSACVLLCCYCWVRLPTRCTVAHHPSMLATVLLSCMCAVDHRYQVQCTTSTRDLTCTSKFSLLLSSRSLSISQYISIIDIFTQ